MTTISREAITARLVALYDRAAAINDRLRRHVDHVTFGGSMNDANALQDECDETAQMIMEHGLRPPMPDYPEEN